MHNSQAEIERIARQKANFICKNCGKNVDCQYAHIIPESWGGAYIADNLLFLCNPCHLKFEVSHLARSSKKAKALIRQMRHLNDNKPKFDVIYDNFEFYSPDTVIYLGNGFKIVNTPIVMAFRFDDGSTFPLLTLNNKDNHLLLSGYFYNERHQLILEIINNKIVAKGSSFWDFEIKRNSTLKLESKDHEVSFSIQQNDDSSLELRGTLFFFGKRYYFKDMLIDPNNNRFSNNLVQCCTIAILLNQDGITGIGG